MDDRQGSSSIEERELCADELCTGIIGPDGRCGVCGKTKQEIMMSGREVSSGEDDADATAGDGGDDVQMEDRIVCPDELCTGIIGKDGRCGVCGKKYDVNR